MDKDIKIDDVLEFLEVMCESEVLKVFETLIKNYNVAVGTGEKDFFGVELVDQINKVVLPNGYFNGDMIISLTNKEF